MLKFCSIGGSAICQSIQGLLYSAAKVCLCTGIQASILLRSMAKVFSDSRHLCSINWGGVHAAARQSRFVSAKFGVAVFKASMLDSLGGSICQSMFVCQVLCTGIQGICQVLCTGVQGNYALLIGEVHWPILNNLCNCLQKIHSHLGGSIG